MYSYNIAIPKVTAADNLKLGLEIKSKITKDIKTGKIDPNDKMWKRVIEVIDDYIRTDLQMIQ